MVRRMSFSPEANDLLQNHSWPGNVRELENTIQRACVLATGNVIMSQDLPLSDSPRSGEADEKTALPGAGALLKAAAEHANDEFGVLDIVQREVLKAAIAAGVENDVGLAKASLKKLREKFGI